MKIPRPRELLGTVLKKAKSGFSKKEPSRREAAGKEATKQDETFGQEPPQTKTPRAEAPTRCNGNLTPVAGSDALTLGMMLYQEHNAPEKRPDSSLQRKPMEDASTQEAAELPPKIVVSPASDQDMGREGSRHEIFTKSDANDYRLDLGEKDVLVADQKSESEEAKRPKIASRRVTFKDASFTGAAFDGATFKGACFDGAHFNGGSFNKASFDGASFKGASFNGGSFQGASFNRASFENLSFGRAGLTEEGDHQSITTQDLNHIYRDHKDEDVTLKDVEQHELDLKGKGFDFKDSKKPMRTEMSDGHWSADARVNSKDAERNELSHKSGEDDESTRFEDYSHANGIFKDADGTAKDEEEPVQPQTDMTTTGQQPFRTWETQPLNLNYTALKHIATTFFSHGQCTNITTLPRGSFHEIRVLHFEDDWTCIARFTRDLEMLCKTESELATIEYVRTHTSIPVPEIYFVNYNENHVVGAPFVFMEYLKGQRLCDVWSDLTPDEKLGIVGQVANVVAQLSELKFDAIGCLKPEGGLGPLLNTSEEKKAMGVDAFTSTIELFFAFLKDDHPERSSAAKEHYPAIRDELMSLMEKETENLTLNPPYRLIHNDFDFQNILVLREDESQPYKITGIIDWDWSYTGPMYYLFEYPDFIVDHEHDPDTFEQKKVLRKHFVASLIEHFPEDPAQRKLIKQCFREKSYTLNTFVGLFMTRVWDESLEGSLVKSYLYHMRGGGVDWERLPYSGNLDWERDSDLTDSDAESVDSDESETDTSIESSEDESTAQSSDELEGDLDSRVDRPEDLKAAVA